MTASDTATRLMDTAQLLIMERGYNAFSYKDLAETVGIRTASIHYHFPSKGDLGVAVMRRYLGDLDAALARIDRTARSSRARLKGLVKVFAETESRGAICMCGSLAASLETLPDDLRAAVAAYLDRCETWIRDVIADGVKSGELAYAGKPSEAAAALLSGLQGALLIARARSARASVLAHVQRAFLHTLGAD
ncbi:MAG: TetR/AcrR family transcriptional regulator [Planctomycetota bacterium]